LLAVYKSTGLVNAKSVVRIPVNVSNGQRWCHNWSLVTTEDKPETTFYQDSQKDD